MEYFDIIESGFSSADETINFGTRSIGCGNLYEISTVACFKDSQNNQIRPEELTVKSIIQNGKVIINIDKSIKVFEDKELSVVVFSSLFDTAIDVFTLSQDGKFLLIGLSSGVLNIIKINQENPTLVYNKRLEEPNDYLKCFTGIFVEKSDEDIITFLVISYKGIVYRISMKNITDDENVAKEFVAEEIYNFSFSVDICEFTSPKLFVNGTKACILNLEDMSTVISDSLDIKKLYYTGQKFLALDKNNNLLRICSLTLLVFPVDKSVGVFEDILVVSDHNVEIIGVVNGHDEGFSIQALSYPELRLLYTLKVPTMVYLTQLESSDDEIMFVAKMSKDGTITELRVQRVFETEPELRVEKLVKKQRFEEAEIFAKNFNVNPMIIKKARAQLISESALCTTEDVDRLMKLLDEIDDDFFRLQCCKLVDCAEVDDVRKILAYGCTLNIKNNSESKDDCVALQNVLVDLLYKFDTFMAIYDTYDMDKWTPFASVDLIEQLKEFLKNGEIESCIILFSRLDVTTINKLTNEKIQEILFIVNNLPTDLAMPFFPTFVTTTIINKPESLPVFVKWLHTKIFVLEKRQPCEFPDCGIRFAEHIIKLLEVKDQKNMLFQRQYMLNKGSLTKLQNLLSALKDIQYLKSNFRINLSLSKYLMGPKEVICTLLNVHLNLQEFNLFLNDFLYDFIIRNQFEPDVIFLEEIKTLLKSDEEYWIGTVEILLKHINSVEIKLTAVREMLKNTKVPWSKKIRSIAIGVLEYTHYLRAEIKQELENEKRLIVLRNPKYGFQEKCVISNISDLKFVINRILYKNEPTSVEDCFKLCKTPEERHEANILLIQKCIRKGELEKALSILSNNSPEEIYECAKWFVSLARITIDFNDIPEETEYYKNILGLIYSKLIDNTGSNIEKQQYKDDLTDIRGVISIRKYFNRNVTSEDLIVSKKKKKLYDDILIEVAADFQKGSIDLIQIIRFCNNLASSFCMDKNKVIIEFCEKVSDFEIILQAAEYLYENNCDSRSLCLVCILLLKYIGSFESPKINFEESTINFLVLSDNDGSNNNFIGGLEMAEKLVRKAMLTSTVDDYSAVMEVMNWVNIGFYLTTPKGRGLKAELFKHMYAPDHVVPAVSTFTAINKTFEVYCRYIEQFKHPNTKFLTRYYVDHEPLSEEQFVMEIQNLIPITNELCRENQHLTAYNLLVQLQKGLVFTSNQNLHVKKLLDSIIKKKCLPQLLHAVTSAKHLDEILFYHLLVLNGKGFGKYVNQYIKLYKRQPNKACAIAKVAVKLMDNYNVTSGREELVNFIVCCKWWKKLENSDIRFDDFFNPDPKARLEAMMAADCMNIDDIKEYCTSFRLDLQLYYTEYLGRVLKNWKPDIEYFEDISGKKNIIVKNDELLLFKKCMEIVDVISSKELVLKLIQKLWSKVNNCYYEVYICMLNIENKLQQLMDIPIQQTDSNKKLYLRMLLFLKEYRRVISPENNQFTPFIDPLSAFRLPFTTALFTNDVWNIIKPELNLKNYKQWFTAQSILEKYLSKDDICTYAVTGVVSSGNFVQDPSTKWYQHSRYDDLLSEIKECVSHITDLEKATAIVYHLMNSMPYGADKVNAAHLSYEYALRYRQQFPDSEEVMKTFIKVKKKYYNFSAMHILFTYKLADEKYLNLVAQSNDLINSLYKDERIIKKSKCIILDCPDINAAVDELGKLFDIDVQKIRYFIVNSCLSHSSSDIDFDSPAIMSSVNSNQTSPDDYLASAIYICSSGNISFWQQHLLIAGSEELEESDDSFEAKEPRSLLFRANALKCFCALSDVDTITQLTCTPYDEFIDSVNKLILRSELEKFGFVMDVSALDEYNKKDLLKRLAKFGNQSAIKTMGILSVTYNIDDLRYWEFIITRAISLGMFEELKSYVEFLKDKSYKQFYVEAWQAIIDNAFNISDDLLPNEIQELYTKNFLMIQSCPVLYSINFDKTINKCIYSKHYDFAALLLQYFPQNQKLQYGKQILQIEDIYKKLENLKNNGVWGVKKATLILGEIQKKLNSG